jgi:hypothetical protein
MAVKPFGVRRLGVLLVLSLIFGALLAWSAIAVPIRAPALPRGHALDRWALVVACYVLVLAVDIVTLLLIRVRRRTASREPKVPLQARVHIPLLVRVEQMRPGIVLTTALASAGIAATSLVLGLPLWLTFGLLILPWIPIYFSIAIWQFEHYGLYSIFAAITLLQLGHLAEHVAQVFQLWITHGNAALSHGIFGQLDIEAVHFAWNVAIWLASCVLLYQFGARNPWLWIAWATASIHTPEHLYIYWLYVTDHVFYLQGGAAGIFGQGGVLSGPLPRPYLHLAYNFIEVTPFVIAFWDQSKIVYDRYLARALPALSEANLITVTAMAERHQLKVGEMLSLGEGDSPRFYVVTGGGVEQLQQDHAVRALRRSEVLTLEQAELAELATRDRPQAKGGGAEKFGE